MLSCLCRRHGLGAEVTIFRDDDGYRMTMHDISAVADMKLTSETPVPDLYSEDHWKLLDQIILLCRQYRDMMKSADKR